MASPKTNPVKKHFSRTIIDFFREYKKARKKENKNHIDEKKYKALIKDFFKELSLKIIKEQFMFIIPHGLGTIYIKSYKPDFEHAAIDFQLTKKHGKVIKYLNLHSYGDSYKIRWDKRFVRFKNKAYYMFKLVDSTYATKRGIGKRGMGRTIKEAAKNPTKKKYVKLT